VIPCNAGNDLKFFVDSYRWYRDGAGNTVESVFSLIQMHYRGSCHQQGHLGSKTSLQ